MNLRHAFAAAMLALSACATGDNASAPEPTQAFAGAPNSPEALMQHIRVLSSDEFEGRAPGTNGERLTLEYIERMFAGAGLQPGVTLPDGTRSWRQETPLIAATLTEAPTLTFTGRDGARSYAYATQFSAWTRRLQDTVTVENAPLVFVGYGVVAPELNWNDYAGIDMRGKIAVILVNDPDFETGVDGGFGGRAMTYYGRWTYKFEEAARQGAAGAIIIHETGPAAYPWAVIQSATGSTRWDIVREDRGMGRAAFEGWMQNDVALETFRRAGLDFTQLKTRAQQQGFRPVPMNLTGSMTLHTSIEQRTTYNVVGVLPGAARPNETILYSAHWDHLGRCPAIDGDDICNGAVDNATGVASLIELARRFSAEGAPERSVAFIALTAEEQGLLGALSYMQHPLFAPRDTVAAINIDGVNNHGPTHDIEVIGFGKSEMDALITAAAQAQGRRVEPDSSPQAGYFYRSDHLHFAQLGIPVLYMKHGIDMIEGGRERGEALNARYVANDYHKPSDEVTDEWDMSGGVQDLELLYTVGHGLADGSSWPQWNANAEFRAVREESRR
ncbi:M28 family peptidase [Terricaulis silvestris]|uniref:Bacterial leucyl aminopeptidase n=1 Tax=Terricaulis silvestris TaxID=2686094 RepID=A0A6I6MJG5_9CAUL|nr:M28 family peptidase [Terricaulis silvestris]QGZ94809.1 Bacterial leucyl aminopeptidase precursor [Terricaulis silvestris]